MFQILLWYPWKGKKEYVPLRTAYSQDSRYSMQPKARQSSRAGAAKTRTKTFELVEEKQKLLDIRERKENARVNGDRYRAMITNFFIPELNNRDVQELWFQQDGAICHTARATIDLLKDTFGDRLISRFGPVNWSPRSCDLTPLD
ncbi:putative transposable element [Trichonephila clavipes]|nr:putative transposable element [Trichonephila clavipes]